MCRLSRKTARERCSNQLHLNRIRVICPVTRKKNMINETLTTLARCTTIASLRVLVLSGGRMAGFRSSVPQTNGNAPPLAPGVCSPGYVAGVVFGARPLAHVAVGEPSVHGQARSRAMRGQGGHGEDRACRFARTSGALARASGLLEAARHDVGKVDGEVLVRGHLAKALLRQPAAAGSRARRSGKPT